MDEAKMEAAAKAFAALVLSGGNAIEVEEVPPDVEHPGRRWRLRLLTPDPKT